MLKKYNVHLTFDTPATLVYENIYADNVSQAEAIVLQKAKDECREPEKRRNLQVKIVKEENCE